MTEYSKVKLEESRSRWSFCGYLFRERRRNETREANHFVDQIIVHARRVIFEMYGDRIRLPDIDDSFEQQLVIVPIHGRVVCRQGRVEGTTSVSR